MIKLMEEMRPLQPSTWLHANQGHQFSSHAVKSVHIDTKINVITYVEFQAKKLSHSLNIRIRHICSACIQNIMKFRKSTIILINTRSNTGKFVRNSIKNIEIIMREFLR